MKTLRGLLILSIISALFISSCNNSSKKENSEAKEEIAFNAKVTIAYFHGERRCPTCIAVGDLAKETYEELFKNNTDVEFYDINIDDEKNQKIAEKYEIAGSALIISAKDDFEDITGFAFKNAMTNPELLKNKISEIVNSYLTKN